jgi:hypothetical protein
MAGETPSRARRFNVRNLGLFVIALSALPHALAAQSPVVPEAVSCTRCTIESQPVVSMGTADGPGSLPGRPWDILVDGKGRYWVALTDHFPMIYDAAGKFVQQFGKRGEGPGEFRFVSLKAVLPGDSMLVSDFRRLVVVAPDLTTTRTIRANLEIGQLRVLQWPRRTVGFTVPNTRADRSSSVRLLDLSGAEVSAGQAFATMPSGSTPVDYASSFRRIGNPKADHFWTAHINRYRLVRYNTSGIAQDSLERKPSWFPGGDGLGMGMDGKPASPQVTDLWEDTQGRLWALTAQPRADGPEAWRGIKREGNEMAVANMPPAFKLWRTMIEVIDPVARRVIARKLLDGYVFGTVPGNRIATFTEDMFGIPRITIHELTLRGN